MRGTGGQPANPLARVTPGQPIADLLGLDVERLLTARKMLVGIGVALAQAFGPQRWQAEHILPLGLQRIAAHQFHQRNLHGRVLWPRK